MKNYAELTKPSVTWLILVSAGVGYYFGLRGEWSFLTLLATLAGTGLLAGGTFTLNQWWERDLDARMRRTAARPVPSGRIQPHSALLFGVVLSMTGYAVLQIWVNTLTACLGFATLASYLFLYTPLKVRTPHATTVGAVPGAMPPLIGFAAARGELSAEAWTLFAILFLWQFPHFHSIAWLYRDDYARAGIRMLPVVEPDGRSTMRQVLACCALLIPVSLLPSALSMSGALYFAGAALLGSAFLWACIRAARQLTLPAARGILLASVAYLPLLYCLMLLDRPQ